MTTLGDAQHIRRSVEGLRLLGHPPAEAVRIVAWEAGVTQADVRLLCDIADDPAYVVQEAA